MKKLQEHSANSNFKKLKLNFHFHQVPLFVSINAGLLDFFVLAISLLDSTKNLKFLFIPTKNIGYHSLGQEFKSSPEKNFQKGRLFKTHTLA